MSALILSTDAATAPRRPVGRPGRRARVQILFAQLFVAPRVGAWIETCTRPGLPGMKSCGRPTRCASHT